MSIKKKRETSTFEKLLLVIGITILIIGYFLINKVFVLEGAKLTWNLLQTIFLWLLMVIFIILLAIGEDIKGRYLQEQTHELREIRKLLKNKKKG